MKTPMQYRMRRHDVARLRQAAKRWVAQVRDDPYLLSISKRDALDLLRIAALVEEREYRKALRAVEGLDTIVRDQVPLRLHGALEREEDRRVGGRVRARGQRRVSAAEIRRAFSKKSKQKPKRVRRRRRRGAPIRLGLRGTPISLGLFLLPRRRKSHPKRRKSR